VFQVKIPIHPPSSFSNSSSRRLRANQKEPDYFLIARRLRTNLMREIFSCDNCLSSTFSRKVPMNPKPSNHRVPWVLAFLTVLISSASLSTPLAAQLVELGKFRLHKFEQPIGEETYEIKRDGDSLAVKTEFKFTDRGAEVPLSVTFRAAQDLTPETFEIKGKTSRLSDIDEAVDVQQGKVRVRSRDNWTEAVPPNQFFTIAGYAPAAMQMLLVRYWAAHGSPAKLLTFPRGEVKIEPHGQETLTVNGVAETFSRYTIEGLIWDEMSCYVRRACSGGPYEKDATGSSSCRVSSESGGGIRSDWEGETDYRHLHHERRDRPRQPK
jgi:hypothetical protein